MSKTEELYNSLIADGFSDLPDYKTFETKLQDKGKREQLHTALSGLYSDIPDFETFDKKLGSRDMTIPERVGDAAKQTGKFVSDTANSVMDTGKDLLNGIASAPELVVSATKNASRQVGNALSPIGKAVAGAADYATSGEYNVNQDWSPNAKDVRTDGTEPDSLLNVIGKTVQNIPAYFDEIGKKAVPYLVSLVNDDKDLKDSALGQAFRDNLFKAAYDLKQNGSNPLTINANGGVAGGIKDFGRNIPALATGAINPLAGAALYGIQTAGDIYEQDKKSGVPDKAALEHSTISGMAQTALFSVPVHKILGPLMAPELNFVQRVLGGAVTGETFSKFSQAVQIGIDKGTVNPNMTLGEAWKQWSENGNGTGAVVGGVLAGAAHPFVYSKTTTEPIAGFQNMDWSDPSINKNLHSLSGGFEPPAEAPVGAGLSPIEPQPSPSPMGLSPMQPSAPTPRKSMGELVAEKLQASGINPQQAFPAFVQTVARQAQPLPTSVSNIQPIQPQQSQVETLPKQLASEQGVSVQGATAAPKIPVNLPETAPIPAVHPQEQPVNLPENAFSPGEPTVDNPASIDVERKENEKQGERVVYDREPTAEDGLYKILGDENNIIYRVNPATGRIQEYEDGFWSNTASNAIARGTARKQGFQKIKGPSKPKEGEAKYDAELAVPAEPTINPKHDAINAQIDKEVKKIDGNPTDAQKEAGNYSKGHITIEGIDIAIENKKGSMRSGSDESGRKWETKMNHHYGYIKRTNGNDGDHVDVFVGESPASGKVYVVDQVNKENQFDEHKVMLGFLSAADAESGYMSNYEKGWNGMGGVTEMSVDDFKEWLDKGNQKKPAEGWKKQKAFDAHKTGKKEAAPLPETQQQSSSRKIGDKVWNGGDEVTITTDPYTLYGGLFQDATTSTGKTITIATPEQKEQDSQRAVNERKEQQAGFKRIKESAKKQETQQQAPATVQESLTVQPETAKKEPWQMTKGDFDKTAQWFHGTGIEEGKSIDKEGFKITNKPARDGTNPETKIFAADRDLAESYSIQTGTPWVDKRNWKAIRKEDKREGVVLPVSLTSDAKEGVDYHLGEEHEKRILIIDNPGVLVTHKNSVQKAISEGKPVPPEVLKDYPDLAKLVTGQPNVVSADQVDEVRKKIDGLRKKGHNFLDSIRGTVLPNGVVKGRDSSARGKGIEKSANKLFQEANDLEEQWFAALYPEKFTADEMSSAISSGLPHVPGINKNSPAPNVPDEYAQAGSMVTVNKGKGRREYRGEIARTLKGIDGRPVYEVKPDGMDTTFRVDGADVVFDKPEVQEKEKPVISNEQAAFEKQKAKKIAEKVSAESTSPVSVDRAELERFELVRQWGDKWQYRFEPYGKWYYANDEAGAVEQGIKAYDKAKANGTLLTPTDRFDKANSDQYAELDRDYGKMSIAQVEAIRDKAKSVSGVSPEKEFTGNGGRRSGVAVQNQGKRDASELSRRLDIYIEERKNKKSLEEASNKQEKENQITGVDGKKADIIANGKEYGQIEYRVVELGDIVSSHDPFTFKENPKYPQERQNRDYSLLDVRGKAEDAIDGITEKNFKEVLYPTLASDSGIPVINEGGVVLSGNNRTFAIQRGHKEYNAALLGSDLKQFGVDANAVAEMKQPVLVRVMSDKAKEGDFVIDSNVSKVKTLTSGEIRKHYNALPQAKKELARKAIAGIYGEFNKSGDAKINTFLGNLFVSGLPLKIKQALMESSVLSETDIQGSQLTSVGIEKVKMLALTLLNEDMKASSQALDYLTESKEGNANLDRKFDAAIGDLFRMRDEQPDIYQQEMQDIGSALERSIDFINHPDWFKASTRDLSLKMAAKGASITDEPLNQNATAYMTAMVSPTLGSLKKVVGDKVSMQVDLFASRRPRAGTKPTTSNDAPAESDILNRRTAPNTMPNYQPPYSQIGTPERPESGEIEIGGRTVKLAPEDKPTRIESIRRQIEDLIGRELYHGKIKGRMEGFYRQQNAEVRIGKYNDIETMGHEAAHFISEYGDRGRFVKALYKRYADELKQLSYTDVEGKQASEGFAEYMRLWFTQYKEAESRAPEFTKAFEHFLSGKENKKFAGQMRRLQDDMHRWFYQGDMARQDAVTSGNQYTPKERVTAWVAQRPLSLMRQHFIDNLHAAKVMEREIHGDIRDANLSAYKQLQLINGVEGTIQESMLHGAPYFAANGDIMFHGPSQESIWKESLGKGLKVMRAQEIYFVSRRQKETLSQGRENLSDEGMINAGIGLQRKYTWFLDSFVDYQIHNDLMRDFFVDCGYVEREAADKWGEVNKNYVPLNREVEGIGAAFFGEGSGNLKRYKGGSQNVKHVYDNIMLSEAQHIKAALRCRAIRSLYMDALNSKEGGKFVAPLGPDSKLVRSSIDAQAKVIAKAMMELGLTLSSDGMIVSGNPTADQITEVSDIIQVLEDNPEMMQFWTFGHKPKTVGTQVDSFINPETGKRQWVEIKSELVADMIDNLAGARIPDGALGTIIKGLIFVKQMQTLTITAAWQFAGPNMVRDTQEAAFRSGGKFVPIRDNIYGIASMLHDLLKREGWYHEMKAQGGGGGGRVSAVMTDTYHLQEGPMAPVTRSKYHPVRVGQQIVDGLLAIADFAEMSTRVGFYIRLRKQGVSAREAAWQARELTVDFRKHGSYAPMELLKSTVPFLGASIQGIDRDIRMIAEDKGKMDAKNVAKINKAKARIYAAGGAFIVAGIALALLNNDDDRYEELTPDQKTRFFHFFIGDNHYTIPKPRGVFPVLFMNAGEALVDTMKGQSAGDAGKFLAFAVAYEFGVDILPGALSPILDLARNKSFTGAPIISERAKKLPAEYQYSDRTSALYVNVGRALHISPDVAQYVVKSYTGYVADYVNEASDAVLWNKEQWGERPFSKSAGDFIGKQFVQKNVPYRTKWTEGYYELKKRAAEQGAVLSDLKGAESIRDGGRMEEFVSNDENMNLVGVNTVIRKIDAFYAHQEMEIASIKYDPALSAKEKERQIDAYYRDKNQILKESYQELENALK